MNKTKIDTTFHFVPIGEEQTLTIIRQLKLKKSMGYDNISQMLLQKYAKYLAKPLTYIINQSLITGVFPNKQKNCEDYSNLKKMTNMLSTTTGLSPFCLRYPTYLRKLCIYNYFNISSAIICFMQISMASELSTLLNWPYLNWLIELYRS